MATTEAELSQWPQSRRRGDLSGSPITDAQELQALANDIGLPSWGRDWKGAIVVAHEGSIHTAHISTSEWPLEAAAEYIAVVENGRTLRHAVRHDMHRAAAGRVRKLEAALAGLSPDLHGKDYVLVDFGHKHQLYIDRVVKVDSDKRYLLAQLLPEDEPGIIGAVRMTRSDAAALAERCKLHNGWDVEVITIHDFLHHAVGRQKRRRDINSPEALADGQAAGSGSGNPVESALSTQLAWVRVREHVAELVQGGMVASMPASDRMTAMVKLDERLHTKWGVGLDVEQVEMLCGSDVEHIDGALDDWEARLGIEVEDLAPVFGVREGTKPGPM